MASYTEKYKLKKPAATDFVDIADINGNTDIIEAELAKHFLTPPSKTGVKTKVCTVAGVLLGLTTLMYTHQTWSTEQVFDMSWGTWLWRYIMRLDS